MLSLVVPGYKQLIGTFPVGKDPYFNVGVPKQKVLQKSFSKVQKMEPHIFTGKDSVDYLRFEYMMRDICQNLT